MLETVKYMSEYAAEQLTPSQDTALISIADPGHAPKQIQGTGWGMFHRECFLDGDYDEETIEMFGEAFATNFAGYLQAEQANTMRLFIDQVVTNPAIKHTVVHCKAGRSRSAAVAKYIAERTTAEISGDHPLEKANSMVHAMLQNPYKYQALIDAQTPVTIEEKKPDSIWGGLTNLFKAVAR